MWYWLMDGMGQSTNWYTPKTVLNYRGNTTLSSSILRQCKMWKLEKRWKNQALNVNFYFIQTIKKPFFLRKILWKKLFFFTCNLLHFFQPSKRLCHKTSFDKHSFTLKESIVILSSTMLNRDSQPFTGVHTY